MRYKLAAGVVALGALLAGCGSGGTEWEIASETPNDAGTVDLTISTTEPNLSDDALVGILTDLYTKRVEGDYRIAIQCPTGDVVARGFLRNSEDGKREIRRTGVKC